MILTAAVIAQRHYWECVEFIMIYLNSMKHRDFHKISFNRKYKLLIIYCWFTLFKLTLEIFCYLNLLYLNSDWTVLISGWGEIDLWELFWDFVCKSFKASKQQDYHRYGQLVTINFLNPYSASEQGFPFISATIKVPYKISPLGYSFQWSWRLGVAPGFPSSTWTYASLGVGCSGPCPYNIKKTCLWLPRF